MAGGRGSGAWDGGGGPPPANEAKTEKEPGQPREALYTSCGCCSGTSASRRGAPSLHALLPSLAIPTPLSLSSPLSSASPRSALLPRRSLLWHVEETAPLAALHHPASILIRYVLRVLSSSHACTLSALIVLFSLLFSTGPFFLRKVAFLHLSRGHPCREMEKQTFNSCRPEFLFCVTSYVTVVRRLFCH
jgi:hypothetical protein